MRRAITVIVCSIWMVFQAIAFLTGIAYINVFDGANIYIDLISGVATTWGGLFGVLGLIFGIMSVFLYKRCEKARKKLEELDSEEPDEHLKLKEESEQFEQIEKTLTYMTICYIVISVLVLI